MVDIASVVNKLSGSLLIASQGYPNSDWVQTKGNVLEFLALTQGRGGVDAGVLDRTRYKLGQIGRTKMHPYKAEIRCRTVQLLRM